CTSVISGCQAVRSDAWVLSGSTKGCQWIVRQSLRTSLDCPSVHRGVRGLSVSTQSRPWTVRQYTETARGLSVSTYERPRPVRQYTETPVDCPSVHRAARELYLSAYERP